MEKWRERERDCLERLWSGEEREKGNAGMSFMPSFVFISIFILGSGRRRCDDATGGKRGPAGTWSGVEWHWLTDVSTKLWETTDSCCYSCWDVTAPCNLMYIVNVCSLSFSQTHTHTHTHTRTHIVFLWFMGTLHRRNGLYTVQTVCAIALHLTYT